MTWHMEILGKRQRRVLAEIGPHLRQNGFYLAGGTAVALHLGHRRSVDLDWFTPEFDDPERFAEILRRQVSAFVPEQIAPGTLHGTVRKINVSFLRYRYPMLVRLRALRGGIHIAGRADLAAMKLLAASQRGAKKDFVDIHALGQRGCTLQQMLRWYQKKFAVRDIAHVLRSLAYFDDADRERLPRMLWDVDWRSIKETIRGWLREMS